MKRPAAALRDLLRDYLAFYRASWAEGKLLICHDGELKSRARRLLASEPGLSEASGKFDAFTIAESCLKRKGEPSGGVFRRLIKAFEFLELICINLFLSPWRKEIKSLKTFTGNFVYYVQSVLPEGVVEKLLEEIGYVATSATEFSLVRKLTEEETEQASFAIFLARIECEDFLETVEDARDSDLVDILQKKRAQKHWCADANLDGKHQPSERNECVLISRRTDSLGPQQTQQILSKLVFEEGESNKGSLNWTKDESQPDTSRFTSEQNTSQSQPDTLASACIKSSDSEDFLIKYSDITIGQKPLQFADLPLKVSEDETQTQNTGLIGSRWDPPANRPWSHVFLSPNASGPQALAILNDVTLEEKVPFGYRTQEPSREIVESKICEATNCLTIHGSDPTDQPKELKGNTLQGGNKFAACKFPGKEGACDLTSASNKEDGAERLMYPVEETAQAYSVASKRGIKDFDHSRMQLTDQPGGDREGFNIDLYSSEPFCNVPGCDCPTVGSSYDRLLVGIPGSQNVGEYFRHVGKPPSSTCASPPEVQYRGSTSADLQCIGEGSQLHSSFTDFDNCAVPVNETSPEGYVIINKDD